MKRGLVIGKFMPLHLGHIAMIRFAASKCDELIVSMSYTEADPINGQLRFLWITEFFKDDPVIRPELTVDNFDDESLAIPERTKIWAEYIRRRLPPVDLVVSSEDYGTAFAAHLGVPHISFDRDRTEVPVSATMIRKNPLRYWQFIPRTVRPYFLKKICFYGPESTGKSSLARYFATLYGTEFVPEVARELIISNDFTVDDIVRIGVMQTERVKEKEMIAAKFLFCDTDLITTEIYSQHYLKQVPPVLLELERQVRYDLYILLDIDVPWVEDGLRDLGHKRREMYAVFRTALEERGIDYFPVSGSWEERIAKIKKRLDEFF